MKQRFIVLLLFSHWAILTYSQQLKNPIIPGVADAGVMRHAGHYYLGGVFTNGDLLISDDLIHWNKRVHAIDMANLWIRGTKAGNDQIHANDMIYLNGTFHMYWSVNYWGKDRHAVHITHAVSQNAEGPYIEPRIDSWMENRIDPMVFQDDDGKLYMYMVKFTDGNTIWGRTMDSPYTFNGEPVCLFSALPDTWETMDNRITEGPFVIKYRGRYYIMYNANHTATEYGNYRLGVCEADTPLSFGNGGKYSHPVVQPNMDMLEENHVDLLRYGSGTYIPVTYKDTINFEVSGKYEGNLALLVRHGHGVKIKLNGELVYENPHPDYRLVNLAKGSALLRKKNILIIEKEDTVSEKTNRISLYAMGDKQADDVLLTPGQPNIVRGPNGFEWWLIYMANRNAEPRSQYIDRIHFLGKKLYVDGITGNNTPGYHPLPSLPTYKGKSARSLPLAGTYLLEASLRLRKDKEAGIVLWERNGSQVEAGLLLPEKKWFVRKRIKGKTVKQKDFYLSSDFRTDVLHTWRLERNGQKYRLFLDHICLSDKLPEEFLLLPDALPSRPEVFGVEEGTGIENIIYTIGWDEWGKNIDGWGNASCGTPYSGSYQIDTFGLSTTEELPLRLFKGRLSSAYEFSVYLENRVEKGKAGIYAFYADERNYCKLTVDADLHSLVIENNTDGNLSSSSYPLSRSRTHYPDVKYTDMIEKQYRFDSPLWIDAIELYRHNVSDFRKFENDKSNLLSIEYLYNGQWFALDGIHKTESSHPAWQRLEFPERRVEALRFININPLDIQRHIYKLKVYESFAKTYSLRVLRENGEMHIFVDNNEICTLQVAHMAGQVGLHADGKGIRFDDILFYQINN